MAGNTIEKNISASHSRPLSLESRSDVIWRTASGVEVDQQ
jgi:hypothetical protein